MTERYFIQTGNQVKGPYTWAELHETVTGYVKEPRTVAHPAYDGVKSLAALETIAEHALGTRTLLQELVNHARNERTTSHDRWEWIKAELGGQTGLLNSLVMLSKNRNATDITYQNDVRGELDRQNNQLGLIHDELEVVESNTRAVLTDEQREGR